MEWNWGFRLEFSNSITGRVCACLPIRVCTWLKGQVCWRGQNL